MISVPDHHAFEDTPAARLLLEKAEVALQHKLARQPQNRRALQGLGLTYRKQGRLEQAKMIYQQLRQVAPDDPGVERMHTILQQQPPSTHMAGQQPAPFVLLSDFLPDTTYARLLPYALTEQQRFNKSKVGEGRYDPTYRESLTLLPPKGEKDWWGIPSRIRAMLPKLCKQLQVAPFDVKKLEIKMTAYQNGHYFKPHADGDRHISYVYFFMRTPKAFSGGELLLFDSDLEAQAYSQAAYTRIIPAPNTIIFFSSPYYHTVTTIQSDANDFGSGRFTVHGHLRSE